MASGTSTISKLDPRNAESCLIEILGLMRRCDEYTELIGNKMKELSNPRPLSPVRLSNASFSKRFLFLD